jgi:hypothetical protein
LNILGLDKLKVKFMSGVNSNGSVHQRCYTLTHSDFTGELFLTIGIGFDKKAISGLYTRMMRDEVLAEWLKEGSDYSLHVYCHVSGGIIIGTAGWRDSIFRREMPLVLECICKGDKHLLNTNTDLKNAPIFVHFQSPNRKYNRIENWGKPKDYL